MKTKNKQTIITLITMTTAVVFGTAFGLFLDWLFLPRLVVCGAVAIVSTLTEHCIVTRKCCIGRLIKKFEESKDEVSKSK